MLRVPASWAVEGNVWMHPSQGRCRGLLARGRAYFLNSVWVVIEVFAYRVYSDRCLRGLGVCAERLQCACVRWDQIHAACALSTVIPPGLFR